jgi:hypothetical protein
MIKKTIIFLLGILFSLSAISQNNIDVIHLKNGKSYKGNIIEQAPNSYYVIQSLNDSTYKFYFNEIEKLTKEIAEPQKSQSRKEYIAKHPRNFISISSGVSISNVPYYSSVEETQILITPLASLYFEKGILKHFFLRGAACFNTIGNKYPFIYTDINGTIIGQTNRIISFDFLSGILSAGYKSNTKVQLFANIGTGVSYMYSAKYELEGDLPLSPIYNKTNILEKEDKPNLLLNAELGFRYKIYKSIYFHHAVSATKYFINNNYGFLMITSGISLGI